MSQVAMDADWLRGKQVAITGRLASMSRTEADALIRAHGGQVVASVNRRTSFVVVGEQPLDKDGCVTSQLRRAHRLEQRGHAIAIVPEQDFLGRLGFASRVHGLYTATQACQILRVSPHRIQAWLRAGLIQAHETVQGVCYFDYHQLSWTKTLCALTRAGVGVERIQRSLELLKHWLPEVEQPLARLGLLADGDRLLVRLEDGQLAEPSGQRHLDFDDAAPPDALRSPAVPSSADDWFNRGCDLEEQGEFSDAADAYRRALEVGGPCADTCFNLANVLNGLGQNAQAVERYRQAIEIDPAFAPAWNNLGNVLAELGERDVAVRAYRRALELAPYCADTHFNLADTLDEMGNAAEARQQWQVFLRHARDSATASYARSRLAASRTAGAGRREGS
jgi:tetratricopeptide (TPR) repeat protein